MLATSSASQGSRLGRTRQGLAPSRSTVYISNLPFTLTNADLYKIFEKFGKLVRVTIMRNKETRESRGVAFLLFLHPDDAQKCVRSANKCQMFGRTLSANIARDNGRAPEFIRRRDYPDKSRCYECGDFGHLSYRCPKNTLGEREPPKKKTKYKKRSNLGMNPKIGVSEVEEEQEDTDDADESEMDESLSGAIQYMQELREAENFLAGSGNPAIRQESGLTDPVQDCGDDFCERTSAKKRSGEL